MRDGLKMLVIAMLLFASIDSHAQKGAEPVVLWRKRVVRKICLPPCVTGDKVKENENWKAFSKALIAHAADGKADVFDDENRNRKLKPSDVLSMITFPLDTLFIDSPAIGKQFIKIAEHPFNYALVGRLKIEEEWTFNPANGITEVQITQIAPGYLVFGDDGVFRGTKSMFWMSWADFCKFFKIYSGAARLTDVQHIIWRDYFKDTAIVKELSEKQGNGSNPTSWERYVTRKVLAKYIVSDAPYAGLESIYDSSITGILYRNATAGVIKVYKSDTTSELLTSNELKKRTASFNDTSSVIDPTTNEEKPIIVQHDFCYSCISEYYVREKWKLELENGKTTINFEKVAPVKEWVNDDGKNESEIMFWINYSDAGKTLLRYNQYYPYNNIEWQLWNGRFIEPFHTHDAE